MAGDPVTAYDSLGNLYYLNMYGFVTGGRVLKSTDNGATWGSSVIAILGGDKCWIAADQTDGPYANYVYVTMTNSSFTGHGFARSTDGGATFTTTFTASNTPLPGAMPAVGPNGNISGGCVYFITNEGNTFAATYRVYRSTDGGATFSLMSTNNFANYIGTNVSGRHTVQYMRTRSYPFIAADNSFGPYRGRLYLVYASNTPSGSGNKPDIFCRYSDDQGTTFSSAVVVNDDPNTTNNHQWHPSIWVEKTTGRLYVKWMDTRDTPTSDSAYIYATYSDDGGVTFAPNQRISNEKMKICATGLCSVGSANYMGDYDAIVSNEYTSMAVWTDFRDNNFGSYTAYFPDFAMLTSPASQTIDNTNGEVFYDINVPDVKLYTDDASFSATVTPTPASGSLMVDFPGGNTISSYPNTIQLRIYTVGTVTNGTYTVNIEGTGPNGTPVHRRTNTLIVDDPVPVELVSFNASINENSVVLNWKTGTETNNSGFEIQRSFSQGDIRTDWSAIEFVEGNGTTTNPTSYQYTDNTIGKIGTYFYRLKQIDFDGSYAYSNEVEVQVTNPIIYELSQNHPNPFNPSTIITYQLPEQSRVTLKVYDIIGKEVATLVDKEQAVGSYEVEFDAASLSSGIYIYRLQAGDYIAQKKMVLVK